MTIRLSAVDEKATLEDISPQPALSTFAQNWRMPAKKDNSSNVGTGQTLLFWREGKDGAIHATVKGKEVKDTHDAGRITALLAVQKGSCRRSLEMLRQQDQTTRSPRSVSWPCR